MNGRLLIADDDDRIREMLQDIFTMEEYDVLCVADGEEVLRALKDNGDVDVVILDLMMPKLSGWDILQYIREHYSVKILVLTALSDEYSEVRSLREGADDYVSKPFRRAVLVERVHRLARQMRSSTLGSLRCGELLVNQDTCRVYAAGEEVRLTSKEYQLLLAFLNNSNRILNRDQILDLVWGGDYEGDFRVVDSQVKMLRRSLGECGSCVRTVRGVGYGIEGEVTSE